MSVADLTGTSWAINSTTCQAGSGDYYINFIYNNYECPETELFVGFSFSSRLKDYIPTSNYIVTAPSIYHIQVGDVISFTGGTDATNATLISWLEANATQVIESSSGISIGSSSLGKAYFGSTEIAKIILNGVTLYESAEKLDTPTNVSVSGTEITFDEVENAESYDILVDGNSIGEYTPQSGYTINLRASNGSGAAPNANGGGKVSHKWGH